MLGLGFSLHVMTWSFFVSCLLIPKKGTSTLLYSEIPILLNRFTTASSFRLSVMSDLSIRFFPITGSMGHALLRGGATSGCLLAYRCILFVYSDLTTWLSSLPISEESTAAFSISSACNRCVTSSIFAPLSLLTPEESDTIRLCDRPRALAVETKLVVSFAIS